jgi:hypothetical protein
MLATGAMAMGYGVCGLRVLLAVRRSCWCLCVDAWVLYSTGLCHGCWCCMAGAMPGHMRAMLRTRAECAVCWGVVQVERCVCCHGWAAIAAALSSMLGASLLLHCCSCRYYCQVCTSWRLCHLHAPTDVKGHVLKCSLVGRLGSIGLSDGC